METMDLGLAARVTALESRAKQIEILLAEVFGKFSASVDHDSDSFRLSLHDLCEKYKYDPEETDAGRRAAGLMLLRIIDAHKGKACDWEDSTQVPHS